MDHILVYCACTGGASKYAADRLKSAGISLADHPMPEITHLLLDVPLKKIPEGLLERLPEKITVVGGNLSIAELEGYRKMDLLQDAEYLARNAAITADCALRVAMQRMETTFRDTPTLIIGWGRIGKCLAALLRSLDCPVTVAVRKERDRAILNALGYQTTDAAQIKNLDQYRLIFNTAPCPVLDLAQLKICSRCIKIDLASIRGLGGEDVIWARGLPGVYAPESSGHLIAERFLKRYKEGLS